MKKSIVISVLMALAIQAYADFDFSAECVTGQTLYYQIVDEDHFEVALVAPGYPTWNGYNRPVGDVVIPEQVEFQENLYTVVAINYAFYECQQLTSVVIPNSVIDISSHAFWNDTILETVVLPNGLTEIKNGSFWACHSLASINIPDSLRSIGEKAFNQCSSLTSITLPNTLEIIGEDAFCGCSSLSGELVLPPSLQSLGKSCFSHCTSLTWVVIPETINIIPNNAFWACSNLSGDLVISDQCTLIGNEAFSGCSSLSSLTIGSSVSTIGYEAFFGCSSLSSLTIGSSVSTIGYSAFMDCTGLEVIHCNTPTLPYTPPINYIGHVIFYNVPSDIPVYVNCLNINQYQNSPNWSQFINMQGVFMGTPSLTVDVNNPDFGTVEVVSVPTDCDDIMATVRAIPYAGHEFGYWKKNGVVVSFKPEYSFALNHNSTLVAYFDGSVTIFDSIGYPNRVVGRKINSSNVVTNEYVSNFSYNQEGILEEYTFANACLSTSFAFDEFPSMPSRVHTRIGYYYASGEQLALDPPVTTETHTFTYEDDHQISQSHHQRTNGYDEYNTHYDYYYTDHKLMLKIMTQTDNQPQINRYSYDNGNKTQIDSSFYGTRLLSVTINEYDDARMPLSSFTTNYNASGSITSQTKKTYTYTPGNKTDSIVTQKLIDNEWVNTGIAHYVYDFKNRVVEYQTGSWSSENSEWNINKKILYDFNDEALTVTISFKQKTDDGWGWDVFANQSLFNNSQMYEYQRQLNEYYLYHVNQFEISLHYNIVEQSFPILSEWYYEITDDDGNITYQHLEYMADTTIGSDRSKIIVRTNQIYDKLGQNEVTHEYIKEHEGKVYWWNKELQEFTVLYDYVADVDDKWEIKVGMERVVVHVDSVGIFEYQGDQRKILHISDLNNVFTGDIVVGYGHLTSFFPEKLMNKNANYKVDGLRCYWVNDALLYHHGDEDCDAIYQSIHSTVESFSQSFTLHPNPTTGHITLSLASTMSDDNQLSQNDVPITFLITSPLGQPLLSGSIHSTPCQINVSSLAPGLYFLSVGAQTLKFVIQ